MNWLAQIAATVFGMVIGALWYSPLLFEKAWEKEVGMTEEKKKATNMPLQIIGSVALLFIIAIFLRVTVLNHAVGEFATFQHGLAHGLGVTIFVVIPILGQKALFDQSGWKLFGMNVGYWLVSLLGMCAILSGWQ